MYWNVVDAKVICHLELRMTFADGLTGRVRMLPSHLRGVFEKLKEPTMFNELRVVDGFVSWPGDLDLALALAPDAMYDEIKQKGEWVLS
ncbi:MAG: DUF2442 domain-containing protein [Magnetococcales bacterium]|nr:DUF2442 domain-containing protein [Magnetococcales bacterium]